MGLLEMSGSYPLNDEKRICFQLEETSIPWFFIREEREATKSTRYTEEQIAYALLREHGVGSASVSAPMRSACSSLGNSLRIGVASPGGS